jgi:hypothetical protein
VTPQLPVRWYCRNSYWREPELRLLWTAACRGTRIGAYAVNPGVERLCGSMEMCKGSFD